MAPRTTIEELSENITINALGRLSKAFAIPLLLAMYWLITDKIDYRFTNIEARAAILETINRTNLERDTQTQAKIAVLDDSMTKGRDDRMRFQADVQSQLKEIRSTLLEIARFKKQ